MKRVLAICAGLLAVAWAAGVYAGNDGAEQAAAVLKSPGPEGEVIGQARFVEDATGRVHVNVHVKGISPGEHGHPWLPQLSL